MEKVIKEFRAIETDDGFRIEIKGDKEAIRRMLSCLGPGFWRAPGRRSRFGFGPGFWGGFGGWCSPWGTSEEKKNA